MIQLVVWTIIAAHGNGTNAAYSHIHYDWRVLTVHNTVEGCLATAKQLGIAKYSCVAK